MKNELKNKNEKRFLKTKFILKIKMENEFQNKNDKRIKKKNSTTKFFSNSK